MNQKLFTTKKPSKVQKIAKCYYCSHKNCSKNPKTKKQKINHHDKIDKECRNEKKLIFKLLIEYSECTKTLMNQYYCKGKVDQKISSSQTFKMIKKVQEQYLKAKKKSKEQFNALVSPLKINIEKI